MALINEWISLEKMRDRISDCWVVCRHIHWGTDPEHPVVMTPMINRKSRDIFDPFFSPKNISCELWRLSCVVWFSTLEIVCKWLVFVCVRVWGFLWLVASELRSALLDIGKLHMNFWHFMRGCPTLCEVKDACDDRWWHRWGLIVFQADNVQGWNSGTDCLRL